MGHLEERWNQLKRRDVLSDVLEEVSEIVEVVSKYGKNPEDDKLVRSMNEVIAKLIVDPKNGNHEKIVQVFRKYLNWIKRFTSSSNEKSAGFYKQLFESTLVAVLWEIQLLLDEEPQLQMLIAQVKMRQLH